MARRVKTHEEAPLAGQDIYKVKVPGRPIKTYTRTQLAKRLPKIYARVWKWPLGTKRVIKLGKPPLKNKPDRRTRVGVHKMHPREFNRKTRKKLCPLGLTGNARRTFIDEGLTMTEQRERGALAVAEAVRKTIESYYENHPEERLHKESRRMARRKAKNKELVRQGKRPMVDYSKLISPAQIAEETELSPLEVRKFLRAKNIGKRGGRYAFKRTEADKIVRALERYYKED